MVIISDKSRWYWRLANSYRNNIETKHSLYINIQLWLNDTGFGPRSSSSLSFSYCLSLYTLKEWNDFCPELLLIITMIQFQANSLDRLNCFPLEFGEDSWENSFLFLILRKYMNMLIWMCMLSQGKGPRLSVKVFLCKLNGSWALPHLHNSFVNISGQTKVVWL